MEKITLGKHRNITIACESDAPIYWTVAWDIFPRLWAAPFAWNFQESQAYINSAKFIEGKYHLNNEYDSKDNRLFDIDHSFVGHYFCVKNASIFSRSSELHNSNFDSNVSNFYLNVKGKKDFVL